MKTVKDTLQELGIPRRYKGYRRTAFAIELAFEDESRLEAVTKEIYMVTAQYFGCDWTAVERSIRTVVLRTRKTNPTRLTDMAGYPLTAPPTASEFIEIIVTYIQRSVALPH